MNDEVQPINIFFVLFPIKPIHCGYLFQRLKYTKPNLDQIIYLYCDPQLKTHGKEKEDIIKYFILRFFHQPN